LLIGNLRDEGSLFNLLKLHTDSEKLDEQSNKLGQYLSRDAAQGLDE